MARHFIHYHRREIRAFRGKPADRWYVERQNPTGGFERPRFHGTRALRGAAAEVRRGDTIWLVAQLYSPWGRLPPAIDARIDVCARTIVHEPDRKSRWRFAAAKSSRWLGLADASAVLRRLRSVNAAGVSERLWKNPRLPVGHSLQQIRRLENGDELLEWERQLDSKGFEFISYRVRDGTRAAFRKTTELVQRGAVVFWDRWSLPRRLAERREQVADNALQQHLESRIAVANQVWPVRSRLYGELGSYSAREFALADRLKKIRPSHID